jgi:DNA-binding HxlR family transcriptional regulator
MQVAEERKRGMYDESPGIPREKALSGINAVGLDEVMYLLSTGQWTFSQLVDAFHPSGGPTNYDERSAVEYSLAHALLELEQDGLVHVYSVVDTSNSYIWWYQLTPVGRAKIQKVR